VSRFLVPRILEKGVDEPNVADQAAIAAVNALAIEVSENSGGVCHGSSLL
jgi:hypothetical protein